MIDISNKGEVILDHFFGRGTTALRARELKRKFVGSDLNPYALVLTKFKISKLGKNSLIKRLNRWKSKHMDDSKKWLKKTSEKTYRELLYYYHKNTLAMLLFIREKIGTNWEKVSTLDNAILAIVLGIMHGKTKKNRDIIYFLLTC